MTEHENSTRAFRSVIHAPYVTARTDLACGVRAGERGEVATVLGLEQAVIVSFGGTMVRCRTADLEAAASQRRRPRAPRRRERVALAA